MFVADLPRLSIHGKDTPAQDQSQILLTNSSHPEVGELCCEDSLNVLRLSCYDERLTQQLGPPRISFHPIEAFCDEVWGPLFFVGFGQVHDEIDAKRPFCRFCWNGLAAKPGSFLALARDLEKSAEDAEEGE